VGGAGKSETVSSAAWTVLSGTQTRGREGPPCSMALVLPGLGICTVRPSLCHLGCSTPMRDDRSRRRPFPFPYLLPLPPLPPQPELAHRSSTHEHCSRHTQEKQQMHGLHNSHGRRRGSGTARQLTLISATERKRREQRTAESRDQREKVGNNRRSKGRRRRRGTSLEHCVPVLPPPCCAHRP
jgi:hypothetical protein